MSSAPARSLPNLGRALRGIVWTALFAVLAAGAAGLIAQASHAPGGPSRAELTSEGDAVLNARLDAATAQLQSISDDVDQLAEDAKTALEEIASADPARLEASLQGGSDTAQRIDTATHSLLASLADLPGGEADAALRYGNDALVRRAAVLAALDAAASLNGNWLQVTAQAANVSGLTSLLAHHDGVVLAAAAKGRSRQYGAAARTLDDAILTVASVKAERQRLVADPGETVLDAWIERNRDYDLALQALYVALDRSHGKLTVKVQNARKAERVAFMQLPPDQRTIIVIVAEVTRGGLTQAVLAIEDARGRMDDALAAAGRQPGGSAAPEGTAPPTASGEPEVTPAPGESAVPLP